MPMFEIIRGTKETPKDQWQVYDTGYSDPQQASGYVKELNATHKLYGQCFMMRRIADEKDYRTREAAREDYKPFEVQGEEYHCAELKGEHISYYVDRFRAFDDVRSEIKLGRYLRQFTDMDDNEIAEICAKNGVECGDTSLKFARTREEIADVYKRGPNSCMSGGASQFDTDGIHPAEVYASPDLAIAYIERDDRPTARTVVHMERKRYIGIYGDAVRLKALLEAEGFIRDENCLEGARVLKLPCNGDQYAAPYLDGDNVYFRDANEGEDPQYLYINSFRGVSGSEDGRIYQSSTMVEGTTYDDFDEYEEYY